MEIIVYTKKLCDRCEQLKAFLRKNNLAFTEKDIEDPEVERELLRSEYVVKNFCNQAGCIVITPIVKLDGDWMHKEFFDIHGFSEKRARKIFGVDSGVGPGGEVR